MATLVTEKEAREMLRKTEAPDREVFKMPDAPATRKQQWKLFTLSKKDWRESNLTVIEASAIIAHLVNGDSSPKAKANGKRSKKASPAEAAKALLEKAEAAGRAAMKEVTPIPMVVQKHVNPLNDNSPVKNQWVVEGGVCGFAWVKIYYKGSANIKFINGLKKANLCGSVNDHGCPFKKDSYQGGFLYWVRDGGQSMTYKEAYGHAFVRVLREAGIDAGCYSRMD
jgi:hypothetical protein